MTTEDRLLLDVTDLAAVRIDCGACGAAITVATPAWETIPPHCPGCGVAWHQSPHGEPYQSLNRLRIGLKSVIAVAPQVGYRVRFEVSRPK